jgi:hypothetical protein
MKDEQWFFNPKANTQNSFIRAPDESTPNAPLGHPWWPSLTAKYKATNGPPVKGKDKESNRGVRLPPLAERFQQLPPMSKKEISDITLKLLEDVSAQVVSEEPLLTLASRVSRALNVSCSINIANSADGTSNALPASRRSARDAPSGRVSFSSNVFDSRQRLGSSQATFVSLSI